MWEGEENAPAEARYRMPGKTITRQSLQTTKVRYICTDIRSPSVYDCLEYQR